MSFYFNKIVIILHILFIFLFLKNLLIFGCTRSSLLCGPFSSWSEWGLLFNALHWLLTAVASFVVGRRLKGTTPQELRCVGSRCGSWALEHGLSSVSHGLGCSKACAVFLDQGSNSNLLHWWVDSLPRSHQGSPCFS